MGSGTFPLPRNHPIYIDDVAILDGIIKNIDKIINDYREGVEDGGSGGGQFDNAASDGAYLEDLKIARMLVAKCVHEQYDDVRNEGK